MIEPWDEYNATLVANVHPPDWVNPKPADRYNLVVIGAGTAGLVTAVGAAGLGAKVALIERHLMGGDCLNVGCVPSKSLIRSSRAVADIAAAAQFGIRTSGFVQADFPAVMERMRRIRAGISRHDSAQRMKDLGVDVFLGDAKFSSRDSITAGGATLLFKRAVIATGGRPFAPNIAGLKETGYLTNENVFDLTALPRRLAVIGGGPIGCELAQAFRRFGAEVVLFHNKAHLLDREDADAAHIVEEVFCREGIQLQLNAKLDGCEKESAGKLLHYQTDGAKKNAIVDEILVSAGRRPNVEGLNLEQGGVAYDSRTGVSVNDYLQTTNPRIYAAGDVCLQWKFTHAADFAARIVIQNALFHGWKRVNALTMPRVTYTDPEIAHVGLGEAEARAKGIQLTTYAREMRDVDRAVVDGETDGFVRIHVKKGSDRILGATIVARHAGEMISEISVAIAAGMGLGKLASVIHPYPTQAEAIRQVGDAYNRSRLTPRIRKLFSSWLDWTR